MQLAGDTARDVGNIQQKCDGKRFKRFGVDGCCVQFLVSFYVRWDGSLYMAPFLPVIKRTGSPLLSVHKALMRTFRSALSRI